MHDVTHKTDNTPDNEHNTNNKTELIDDCIITVLQIFQVQKP